MELHHLSEADCSAYFLTAPLATNNDTIPVMLAVDVNVMGYSGFEPEFADLVRTGRAAREFWLPLFESLEYLGKRGQFLPRCVDRHARPPRSNMQRCRHIRRHRRDPRGGGRCNFRTCSSSWI